MSFWRTFGFHTVSAVETILDRESFTLEELMDEEEILQEVKSQNKKLMDFLTQPATLYKLFDYITNDPPEEADPKRRFKYPFLACEVLCSEIWVITEAIFKDETLLDVLFTFLDKPHPINPLLASYTSRVAIVLLSRRTAETLAYIKKKDNIISKFMNHLASASIMELLLKIIGSEESPEGAGVIQWLCGTDLVVSLLGRFDPSLDEEVHENAGQTLADIITISAHIPNSPLIAQFESDNFIRQLFKYVLSGNNSVMLHGLSVVIELLRRHAKDNTDDTTPMDGLSPLLSASVSLLEQFNTFLKTPVSNDMITTMGQINPLGFYRLKVVDFYLSLLRTRYRCIDDKFVSQGSLKITLELFFTYRWNNFLHATVEQIIHTILEGQNEDLKVALLIDAGLLDRIVEANKLNIEESNRPRNARLGYMGFLTTISLAIANAAATSPKVEELIDSHAEWKNYVNTSLTEIRTIETKPLGGHRPIGMPGGFTDDFPEDANEEYEEGDMTFDTTGGFVNNYNPDDKTFELYDEENNLEDVNSDDSDDEQDEHSWPSSREIADVGSSPSEGSGFPERDDHDMMKGSGDHDFTDFQQGAGGHQPPEP